MSVSIPISVFPLDYNIDIKDVRQRCRMLWYEYKHDKNTASVMDMESLDEYIGDRFRVIEHTHNTFIVRSSDTGYADIVCVKYADETRVSVVKTHDDYIYDLYYDVKGLCLGGGVTRRNAIKYVLEYEVTDMHSYLVCKEKGKVYYNVRIKFPNFNTYKFENPVYKEHIDGMVIGDISKLTGLCKDTSAIVYDYLDCFNGNSIKPYIKDIEHMRDMRGRVSVCVFVVLLAGIIALVIYKKG